MSTNVHFEALGDEYPEIDEAYLKELEAASSAALPADYRELLLRVGRVFVASEDMIFKCENGEESTTGVFFAKEPGAEYDLIGNFQEYIGRVPSSLLPIGSDSFGNLICLGISAPDLGKVYFWDHEQENGGGFPHRDNIHKIADSFTSFLENLKAEATDEK